MTPQTIEDGIAVRLPMKQTFEDLKHLVKDTVLVDVESIKKGMKFIHEHLGVVAEPSAAVGISALIENQVDCSGKNVATLFVGEIQQQKCLKNTLNQSLMFNYVNCISANQS